jgi:hypothetical protein
MLCAPPSRTMPLKWCLLCNGEYWSRWRNTPAVCEGCKLLTVICSECERVVRVEADPAQLDIFGGALPAPRARLSHVLRDESEPYVAPPVNASGAARRRSPYH